MQLPPFWSSTHRCARSVCSWRGGEARRTPWRRRSPPTAGAPSRSMAGGPRSSECLTALRAVTCTAECDVPSFPALRHYPSRHMLRHHITLPPAELKPSCCSEPAACRHRSIRPQPLHLQEEERARGAQLFALPGRQPGGRRVRHPPGGCCMIRQRPMRDPALAGGQPAGGCSLSARWVLRRVTRWMLSRLTLLTCNAGAAAGGAAAQSMRQACKTCLRPDMHR